MTTRSDDYEEYVHNIIKGIKGSGRTISELSYGRSNKISGISDIRHQIDVSFIDKSFTKPTRVLIECKLYSTTNKINLAVIKTLFATIKDIKPISNEVIGMVVTTSSFQRGAKKFAQHYQIKTEELLFGPECVFQYEDIITIKEEVSVPSVAFHTCPKYLTRCKRCNTQFEQIDDCLICTNCGFDNSETSPAKGSIN